MMVFLSRWFSSGFTSRYFNSKLNDNVLVDITFEHIKNNNIFT